WVQQRIDGGDTICAANQQLRVQDVNFEDLSRALEFYPPDEDARRLSKLVRTINVPVYLTGGWQDEQTGSLFATMLDDFVSAPQGAIDRFQFDPAAGATTYSNSGAYDFVYPMIEFHWPPLADGLGLSYITEPLAEDTVVAGNGGYANLWFASDAADADVEVT